MQLRGQAPCLAMEIFITVVVMNQGLPFQLKVCFTNTINDQLPIFIHTFLNVNMNSRIHWSISTVNICYSLLLLFQYKASLHLSGGVRTLLPLGFFEPTRHILWSSSFWTTCRLLRTVIVFSVPLEFAGILRNGDIWINIYGWNKKNEELRMKP